MNLHNDLVKVKVAHSCEDCRKKCKNSALKMRNGLWNMSLKVCGKISLQAMRNF